MKRNQGRQFKEGYKECPVLGSKFLLFDGWWELSNDIIEGPLYRHKCPFIQKVQEE